MQTIADILRERLLKQPPRLMQQLEWRTCQARNRGKILIVVLEVGVGGFAADGLPRLVHTINQLGNVQRKRMWSIDA